jgi:hypothetical protein
MVMLFIVNSEVIHIKPLDSANRITHGHDVQKHLTL